VAGDDPQSVATVPGFRFLTNHAKTLILIAHDRRIRIRDIATQLEITERATQRIVADLANAGYLKREREGRRNVYTVKAHVPLGLPTQRDINVASLLAIISAQDGAIGTSQTSP
jgi:predicted transcriptional regulator of viral defense system